MANENDQKQEGAAYPYFALPTCLAISDAVRDLGGARAEVARSLLASHLKEPESGSFLMKLTSCKCFGLISGRTSFVLTERAKRYYFPTNENDKSSAVIEFFTAPPAFNELVRRFDGNKLPTMEILGNVLHRELGVPDSWKDKAANNFVRSAQFLAVIDEGGFLRYKAAHHGAKKENPITPPPQPPALLTPPINRFEPPPVTTNQEPPPVSGNYSYVLPLPRGRKVVINAPLDITSGEIKRLQKWVEVTLQVDWGNDLEPEAKTPD